MNLELKPKLLLTGEHGKYVEVEVEMQRIQSIIVSLYVPNEYKIKFKKKSHELIMFLYEN